MLTLIHLRLNLPLQLLSYQFNVSVSAVSRYFLEMIDVMYIRMKVFINWPDRYELQQKMPMQFRKHFGKKVTIIIDCFEVFIDRPSNLLARAQTWSTYKHHNTIKFLIGITPNGSVSYISNAWGGRVSDKYITENSGFLDKLLPGDIILADRGFNIAESAANQSAEAKIPAFTRGKTQLDPVDIELTRKLASLRIHIERVIGSVRQKYTILSSTIPIDLLICKKGDCIITIDKICHVCCALVNLCGSVISND